MNIRVPFDNTRVDCQVDNDRWTADLAARAYNWNWGNKGVDADQTKTPKAIAIEFKSHPPPWWNVPIIQSLLNDLHFAFYNCRFQDAESDSLFIQLRDCANGFLNHIILRFDSQHLFETGRAISHVFADIIACVSLLHEKAGRKDDKSTVKDQIHEIVALREWFWHSKLGMSPVTNCLF